MALCMVLEWNQIPDHLDRVVYDRRNQSVCAKVVPPPEPRLDGDSARVKASIVKRKKSGLVITATTTADFPPFSKSRRLFVARGAVQRLVVAAVQAYWGLIGRPRLGRQLGFWPKPWRGRHSERGARNHGRIAQVEVAVGRPQPADMAPMRSSATDMKDRIDQIRGERSPTAAPACAS